MKIRAAVLEEFGQPLVVQDVDLAEPRAGEVLVRLHACGVCHTDMFTASGIDPSGYKPCVLGHEGAGIVEAVGLGQDPVDDIRATDPRVGRAMLTGQLEPLLGEVDGDDALGLLQPGTDDGAEPDHAQPEHHHG